MRVCAEDGCPVRLRPGNASDRCFKHGGSAPERIDTHHGSPGRIRPGTYDPRRDRPPPAVAVQPSPPRPPPEPQLPPDLDRRHRYVTVGGITRSVGEWMEHTGITNSGLRNRLRRGWSLADALSTPPRPAGGEDEDPA